MSERQSGDHHNGDQPEIPTERTPLIAPPPTRTLDAQLDDAASFDRQDGISRADGEPSFASDSAGDDDGIKHTQANQRMSIARTIVCTISLAGLMFLQATNISLLTTTQDDINADLESFERSSWFTSAYLIALAALSPLNGKLSAVFSPRLCIFAAAVMLAVGAVICSAANSFATFVVGRVLCGAGASGIYTISTIIVLEITGSKQRGFAIGLLNSGYTAGVAIGAVVAGALVQPLGWRALFWLQAPIALAGGAVLFLAIPSSFTTNGHGADRSSSAQPGMWARLVRLDYLGALTLTASIILLLYALSSPKSIPILPLLLSPIVLVVFLLNEKFLAHDPIVPISLLRSRGMLLTCLGTTGLMMGRWAVLFHTPTYALAVRAFSPAAAGSILVPTNAGFALGGLGVGLFHIRRKGSFYLPTLLVYALFPVTLLALALLVKHDSPAWAVILVVLANGLVTGAALNYNLAHLLHLIPPESAYVATALLATFRGFAGSFGSAVGGGLFLRALGTSLRRRFAELGMHGKSQLVTKLLGSPRLVRSLDGVDRNVAVAGYEDGLRVLFLAAAALAVGMVLVQAGTGWKSAAERSKLEVDPRDNDGRHAS